MEKKKNTRKVMPVLVGVTRDGILRMDYETKEVIKQWPLTHLRRWAASDKTFTLDFGDYEEDYMTFITTEGALPPFCQPADHSAVRQLFSVMTSDGIR